MHGVEARLQGYRGKVGGKKVKAAAGGGMSRSFEVNSRREIGWQLKRKDGPRKDILTMGESVAYSNAEGKHPEGREIETDYTLALEKKE